MGLSEYQKIRAIGKGSFGKNVNERKYYAMKIIRTSGISQAEQSSVQREIKFIQKFTHPNIVSYKDDFLSSDGKNLCIVMTYCEGGDLQSIITKAKQNKTLIPESTILHYFVQILLGLEYMHHNSVLHRDIKTQNIFLLGNGRLVLGDLGISTNIENKLARTTIGTPYYMSPEIYKNLSYDYKSDVWALGGNTLPELTRNVLRGVYSPLPSLYSKDVKSLIHCMLCTSPNDRISTRNIFKLPLIKLHVSEFIVDIMGRSKDDISDGTLCIQQAIYGVAADSSDWTIDSTLPESSEHAKTIKTQIQYLELSEYITEKISKKNKLPIKRAEIREWKDMKDRELKIQEKKCEILQEAIQRVHENLSKNNEKIQSSINSKVVPPKPIILQQTNDEIKKKKTELKKQKEDYYEKIIKPPTDSKKNIALPLHPEEKKRNEFNIQPIDNKELEKREEILKKELEVTKNNCYSIITDIKKILTQTGIREYSSESENESEERSGEYDEIEIESQIEGIEKIKEDLINLFGKERYNIIHLTLLDLRREKGGKDLDFCDIDLLNQLSSLCKKTEVESIKSRAKDFNNILFFEEF